MDVLAHDPGARSFRLLGVGIVRQQRQSPTTAWTATFNCSSNLPVVLTPRLGMVVMEYMVGAVVHRQP